MTPISNLRDLFDKVVLPIGAKAKYVLLIRYVFPISRDLKKSRSFWPLYHCCITLYPRDKQLKIIVRDTKTGDASFGRNGPMKDGTYRFEHGRNGWSRGVNMMYQILRSAETWRKERLEGQTIETQDYRSWRFLCKLLFREWDSE